MVDTLSTKEQTALDKDPVSKTIKKRPDTLEAMKATIGRLYEALHNAAEPPSLRPDDVVIAPYAKCGTTWLQQIFHCLRTRGDTDYDDISRVVPWIETSPGLGLSLEGEQVANPRGFKSHLPWDAIPGGGRYIVSFRDPGDAVVSCYKFFEGWFFEPGTVTLDDFVLNFYLQRPPENSYWHHLASWWEQREQRNLLLLSFEGMKADHRRCIERVASFCHIPLDEDLLKMTLNNSSLEFMKTHRRKFNDLLMRKASEKICDLPLGSDAAKVREGEVGSNRKQLSETAAAALNEAWHRQIENRFGFRDYGEFQQALEK